jgi:hypothetical protein
MTVSTHKDGSVSLLAPHSLPDSRRQRVSEAFRRVADVAMAVAPEWLSAIPAVGGLLRALLVTVDRARRTSAARGPSTDRLVDLVCELSDGRPVVVLLYDPRRSHRRSLASSAQSQTEGPSMRALCR